MSVSKAFLTMPMIETTNRNRIVSGIEPIDGILGGLESSHLYLTRGETDGKSLFGMKFLIEGLKRGETVAMVIDYAPEDAVRRFARLGYECLDDIRQNRLVILDYSSEITKQLAELTDLTLILRKLEWWLRERQPRRILFDPIQPLITSKTTHADTRVQDFVLWATSFKATVLMVANSENPQSLYDLLALVRESFRFDVRDNGDALTRYFAFEKTPAILEQAIEIDPHSGVFLLQRNRQEPAMELLPKHDAAPPIISQPLSTPAAITGDALQPLQNIFAAVELDDAYRSSSQSSERRMSTAEHRTPQTAVVEFDKRSVSSGQTSSVIPFPLKPATDLAPAFLQDVNKADNASVDFVSIEIEAAALSQSEASAAVAPVQTPATVPDKVTGFSEFLQDIEEIIGSIQFDDILFRVRDEVGDAQTKPTEQDKRKMAAETPANPRPATTIHNRRVSDRLLREQATAQESRGVAAERHQDTQPQGQQKAQSPQVEFNPADFKILFIGEDGSLSERIGQTLKEYSMTTVADALQGIANAMSSNPDLVILDVDMLLIDGFKVLAQIRACVNAPIITLSESRLRASDRILSTELGSDYYLTKPVSLVEIKQKVRQLLARYRGINTWITNSSVLHRTLEEIRQHRETKRQRPRFADEGRKQLVVYEKFIAQIETQVKAAMGQGTAFSIVGINLEGVQKETDARMREVYTLVSRTIRSGDLLTKNPRNELVALLNHSDTNGAKAFIERFREKLAEGSRHELSVWVRSFPSLEEDKEQVGKGA